MPVELRKRPARDPAPAPPPAKKKAAPKKAAAAAEPKADAKKATKKESPPAPAKATNGKKAAAEKPAPAVNGSAKADAKAAAGPPSKGDTVSLDGFGGEVETQEGVKTTLKALVEESKAGVILFTYGKASTPGCTKQACYFRDSHSDLTAGGLAIYGLSGDSPKDNTKFKEKQKLPYPLLCDPKATLLEAIGLKKAAGKATRGIFAVDKAGKVLLAQPGSPEVTHKVAKELVASLGGAADGADDAAAKENDAADEKKDGEEKAAEPAAVENDKKDE